MVKEIDILVIDDDKDLVDTIRTILEIKNFNVRTAYNGKEGYKKIEEKIPDLIILDVMMSTDTEGFDFAYKLKNNTRYREIPIIMTTSFPQEMARSGPERFQHILGESWPVTEFLEKPVDPDDLISTIEDILKDKNIL
jgi:CheY-like chemotaxis protein